jgi:hypothetical protein
VIPIGRDEAADRAAQELLGPEYEREPLLDRLYRHVDQFIGDLLDTAAGGGDVGGVIAAAVITAILVGVVALVAWHLRRTSRRNASATAALFGERRMTAAEHREAAARLAVEGRHTEAIQERMRAIARDLEERALVDGMPGRTADELSAEAARALPAFADELAAAARSFDDVTYGGVPGTRQAYESMSSLDERLRVARPVPLAAAAAPAADLAAGPVAGSNGTDAGGAWPGGTGAGGAA